MKKDTDFEILKELKNTEGYVSGEDLASRFDISRQALWKHIGKLTDKGYQIIAVPHLGYKLESIPDKLYPWEIQYKLNTKKVGKDIFYHDDIDSTQDAAWKLGISNSPEGSVVISESQGKGRGRMDRKWISPKGGIYFSLLLRPDFITMQDISQITLLMGLACLRGMKKTTSIECALKWPNDLFIENKKLGGILCEVHAEPDRVHFIVAGVGINVNAKDLPKEATSLFLHTKKRYDRLAVIRGILEEVESFYEQARKKGFKDILTEWSKYCLLWGKRIKVKVLDNEIEGEARGIDERGYLLLQRDNGLIEKISSGDVIKVNR